MKGREPKSLKKSLLTFTILCWIVPVIVFFTATTVSYQKGIIERAESLMQDELMNITSFASIRIGDAITMCQRPSYEKTWENSWKSYSMGKKSKNDYLQEVNASLKSRFYTDERFNLYAYYCYGYTGPECYSSRTRIPYRNYVDYIRPEIQDIIDSDSSYTHVRVIDGRVFVIRNLYTTMDYQRYGTLVVELNRDKIFQDIPENVKDNMIVCIGDNYCTLDFTTTEDADRQELAEELFTLYDGKSNHKISVATNSVYNAYLYQEKQDAYHIGVMVFAERRTIYSSLYEIYTIVGCILLGFIPVIWYATNFLRKQIQIPLERMMEAYKKVEEGEIGSIVEGGRMPNAEFQYLMERFDSMSLQVKYLFDYVYDEKIARKDAQIQALQAQINPHFLNNTLEMMNWQARMSGDVVVSKMIESLGTVLDYRMNRANVKEIHLAEELQCTDAYFYIMSMRFGQRLQIEKEIDEDLLYIMVPPLILQPIVENAIVHGVEAVKNGLIRLKVSHDENCVYLQVRNTGKKITEEDKQRIAAMLNGDVDKIPKVPGRHTSIGINNVNRRIKLVYGEEYGLDITQNEENVTLSTITIPYHKEAEKGAQSEQHQMEDETKSKAKE